MQLSLGIVLDALVVLLVLVLLFIVYKRFVLTSPRRAVPANAIDGAQEMLERRDELKAERVALRKQFFGGELDRVHFRLALSHNSHELQIVESRLRKMGFG